MTLPSTPTRRTVLASAMAAAAAPLCGRLASGAAPIVQTIAPPASSDSHLFKSVKWGMIQADGVRERFELCRDLGFDGVELVSPLDFPVEEIIEASQATGLPVHGVVDMKHWDTRLSSPDEKVRAQGGKILEQALHDAKRLGGSSVLLVPGKVTGPDETHQHVWERSIPEIRKVLPTASRLGVRVLIENVWNGFCERPELLRDYLDEIASPWVGAYFDIGNVRKFGPSEDWVRVLGERIVKLDVKDWRNAPAFEGFNAKIGEGDVNWSAVNNALRDIGFSGWCTAEVSGGGRDRLSDIAARMNRALNR